MKTNPIGDSIEKCEESLVKKRIDYIDYAKAIGIILVIIGHVNNYNAFCKPWVYSFHMPLFFLLSGMLIRPEGKPFKASIISKFKRLIVPYFIWGLIYAPLSIKNILLICYGSHVSLSMADSLTSLWFFPVLFFASLCAETIISIINKKNCLVKVIPIIVAGASLLIGFLLPVLKYGYLFGLNSIFTAIGFLLIGCCGFNLVERLRRQKFLIKIIVLIFSILISFGAYLNIPSYGYVLMAEGYYGNPVIFLIVALAGCLFVITLSMIIEYVPGQWLKNGLLFIGRNSIAYIVLQKPVISIFERVLEYIKMPNILGLIITTLGSILVCYLVTKVINYFLPQIFGRSSEVIT